MHRLVAGQDMVIPTRGSSREPELGINGRRSQSRSRSQQKRQHQEAGKKEGGLGDRYGGGSGSGSGEEHRAALGLPLVLKKILRRRPLED